MYGEFPGSWGNGNRVGCIALLRKPTTVKEDMTFSVEINWLCYNITMSGNILNNKGGISPNILASYLTDSMGYTIRDSKYFTICNDLYRLFLYTQNKLDLQNSSQTYDTLSTQEMFCVKALHWLPFITKSPLEYRSKFHHY